MSTQQISIPEDLLRLKASADLESVSLSSLARKGTSVLQKILSTAQAVVVKVQGQGAMVTLSQGQYDEMVALIDQLQQLQNEQSDDGFTQALSQHFDELVADMNRPGAAQATNAVLFGSPASLNETYRPGDTETHTKSGN